MVIEEMRRSGREVYQSVNALRVCGPGGSARVLDSNVHWRGHQEATTASYTCTRATQGTLEGPDSVLTLAISRWMNSLGSLK